MTILKPVKKKTKFCFFSIQMAGIRASHIVT